MHENPPTIPTPKGKRRTVKVTDIIIFIVIAILIIVLAKTLVSQLNLRNEVKSAKVISDRTISDIQKQNATDVHLLGDKSFQADHSTAELKTLFKAAQPYLKGSASTLKQTVSNSSTGQMVSIRYKFNATQPYYLQIVVSKPKGTATWQLFGLSGSQSESSLTTE